MFPECYCDSVNLYTIDWQPFHNLNPVEWTLLFTQHWNIPLEKFGQLFKRHQIGFISDL